MATQTQNLNLVLPDYADKADIGVVNDNFKKIDDFSGGGKVEEWIDSIQKKADESLAKIAQDATSYLNNIQTEANESLQEIQTEATESLNEIENKAKNSLESIPDDYEVLAGDVSHLKDQKADAILDTSDRAASHALHAQDGPLAVTLYGKTTETGSGDKSPDNPYVIRGVDTARVHAGGKNLFNTPEASATVKNVTYTLDGKGTIKISGTNATTGNIFMLDIQNPITIQPGMRIVIDATEASGTHGLSFRNTVTGVSRTINSQAGKVVTFNVGSYHAGQTFNHVRDWINSNTEYNDTIKIMFTYSPDNEFEPYNASVITPQLLPDGAPLMGNGTVDDTIENDVLSGCDKKIVLDGTQFISVFNAASWKNCVAFMTDNTHGVLKGTEHVYGSYIPNGVFGGGIYSSEYACANPNASGYLYASFSFERLGIAPTTDAATGIAAVKAYLAANPLTVYYRSTEYTPDKDLRVCKTVRRWRTEKLCDRTWSKAGNNGTGLHVYYSACSALSAEHVAAAICNVLPTVNNYSNTTPCFYAGSSYNGRLWIVAPADVSGSGALETWLTDAAEASYALSTPEVYMTDPLPIRKPTGIMPVTVTGSAETSVSYPHDTADWGKCAASTMIGAAESGMTATKNYAIGDFIVDKDALTLYRATKAIANGESIVPGTNCTATTVVEQLAAIYTILNA